MIVTVWQFDLGSGAFVTLEARNADQQNELKCVSTIIGHLIARWCPPGFIEGHAAWPDMGCSQGYINRVHAIHPFILSTGVMDMLGGWEGVNIPYRAWDGVHLIYGIHVVNPSP
eukprot:1183358-Prorocentrum_minimum.AAC.1